MPAGSDTQLQALIELANRGDAKAKERLLEYACERLLKLTRKMFRNYPGLRRFEATDDVFTNALVRLSKALEAVHVESVRHFFNLAGLQIRRALLDLKKSYFGPQGHGRNHHTDHQPSDDAGGSLSRSSEEPDDLDRWAEFHAAVESLPEELREVANLLYYEGLSQDEASEVLGISIRTLKRRWHNTKQRLHRVLRDEPG